MTTYKFNTSLMDDFLGQVRPFTIGFDRVVGNLNNVAELANNYPPYNIIKKDEESFELELACAGFRKEEFNINVVPEGNKLVVQGVQDRSGEDVPEYTYQGIAARNFTRTFALSEDTVVDGAEFIDGMLKIQFSRIIPEEKKAKTIDVK